MCLFAVIYYLKKKEILHVFIRSLDRNNSDYGAHSRDHFRGPDLSVYGPAAAYGQCVSTDPGWVIFYHHTYHIQMFSTSHSFFLAVALTMKESPERKVPFLD